MKKYFIKRVLLLSLILFSTIGYYYWGNISIGKNVPRSKKPDVHLNRDDRIEGIYIDENATMCRGTNMSFFTLSRKFDNVEADGKSLTVDACLETCYKKETLFAGYTSNGNCYCQNSSKGFITEGEGKGCEAACSSDRAMNISSPRRIQVFGQIRCYKEINRHVIDQRLVGYVRTPSEDSLLTLALLKPSAEQCFLNCEKQGKPLAVPILNTDACVCSDFLSLFENVEQLMRSRELHTNSTLLDDQLHPVYKTFTDDPHCGPKRFLKRLRRPITGLISLPGSGNTWMRHLIETATGFYTGSVYNDMKLYNGGFLGERENYFSYRTLTVKDHCLTQKLMNEYSKAILILRNIKHACLAEFTRGLTKSHKDKVDPKRFKSAYFAQKANKMRSLWLEIPKLLLKTVDSVLVVYFEDVVRDPIKEVKRIVDYLQVPDLDRIALKSRLMCASLQLTGSFKRPPKNLTFDPYDEKLKLNIQNDARKLDDLLKSYNQPALPASYFDDHMVM